MNQEKLKMTSDKNQDGFSYIDLMISVVIMMVGILGLTGALTVNLMRSYEAESQLLAKQYALSSIESIFAARDIAADNSIKGWDQVGNVGTNPVNGVPRGIFLTGFRPIREDEGWDGVSGTADDACATGTACTSAGNPPNRSLEAKGFLRRIVITNITGEPGKRRIEVTVRYAVNRAFRDEVMATMITTYQ